MAALYRLGLRRQDIPTQFAGNRASEKSATHSYTPVNTPTIDSHTSFGQGSLPGKHVSVNGINESSVQIEN
jgi:hypothetical protein